MKRFYRKTGELVSSSSEIRPIFLASLSDKGKIDMWCKHCQQDTPGLGSADGSLSCGRCRQSLTEKRITPDPLRRFGSIWDLGDRLPSWENRSDPTADREEVASADWSSLNWVTSGLRPPRGHDSATTKTWRIDPPVTQRSAPEPRQADRPQPAARQQEDRAVAFEPRFELAPRSTTSGQLRFVDSAHSGLRSTPSTSNRSSTWWMFLLGMNAMLCGAALYLAGQWSDRWSAPTQQFTSSLAQVVTGQQSRLGFAVYVLGQLLAIGCLAGLVFQLHRCWQKTHGLVRALSQHFHEFLAMRPTLPAENVPPMPVERAPRPEPQRMVRLDEVWGDA